MFYSLLRRFNTTQSVSKVRKTKEFRTICYLSNTSSALSQKELFQIFDVSIKNNNLNAISGTLIYSLDRFFQILEGPSDTVLKTFENIKKDSRHNDINTIFNKPSAKLHFEAYTSSFSVASTAKEIQDINSYIMELSDLPLSDDILGILKKFEISAGL